jgi:hypothetical protein
MPLTSSAYDKYVVCGRNGGGSSSKEIALAVVAV